MNTDKSKEKSVFVRVHLWIIIILKRASERLANQET